MDPISLIHAANSIVNQVKRHSTSIEDTEKIFKSFKLTVDPTRKLLAALETFKEGHSDVLPNSPIVAGSKRDRLALLVDEYDDQLKRVREALEEIVGLLENSEPGSSRLNIAQHFLTQQRLKKERVGKIMAFSSELERFIATMNLVLTIALRYEHLLVKDGAVNANGLVWMRTVKN